MSTNTNPEVDRRTVIKTVGAAGGAAVVGSGAVGSDLGISPVQKGQAIAPVVAAGAVGIAVGAGAGAAAYKWVISGADGVDEGSVIADQIYDGGLAVANGREAFVKEMSNQFDPNNPQDSPFANLAWSRIRSITAEARAAGKTAAEAKSEANDALKRQATRSVVNIVERWNSGCSALVPYAGAAIENGEEGVFDYNPGKAGSLSEPGASYASGLGSNLDTDGDGDPNGQYAAVEFTEEAMGLPVSASELEGRDEKLTVIAMCAEDDDGNLNLFLPVSRASDSNLIHTGEFGNYNISAISGIPVNGTLAVNTNDREKTTILSADLHQKVLKTITAAYQSISNNLGTYVDTLYAEFAQGALSPSEIISPQDIYDNFATSGEQKRFTAELIAVGASVPDNQVGFKVEVSHPDLAVDSQWGVLYPVFADGVTPPTIQSGVTIPSADYDVAYLGYPAQDTGEWTTTILSGDSDLKILSADNRDDDIERGREGEQTAGANGKVVVWDEDVDGNPPDPLKYPESHPDWYVEVQGATNQDSQGVQNLTTEQGSNDQTLYVLEPTSLNEGELIEAIYIRNAPKYEQPSKYVSDPTTATSEELKKRIETYRELRNQLEKIGNGGTVGGGLFGDGLPTLPGLGVVESAVVVILGIAGLNALSS